MRFPGKLALAQLMIVLIIWIAVGFSLGWYYTATHHSLSGWPMPTPESCAALALYYFSSLDVSTKIQWIHWLLVFPVVGILWVLTLSLTAPFFGGRSTGLCQTLRDFAVASLPLAAPGPAMAFLAGLKSSGFSLRRMFKVALRYSNMPKMPWPTLTYIALAVAALIWQIYVYRRTFGIQGRKAFLHFITSTILLTVLACGIGVLTAIPLRMWLE